MLERLWSNPRPFFKAEVQLKVTSSQELLDMMNDGKKIVALFTQPGCSPCSILKKRLIDLEGDVVHNGASLIEIRDPNLLDKFSVRSVPMVYVFDGPVIRGHLAGLHCDDALQILVDSVIFM